MDIAVALNFTCNFTTIGFWSHHETDAAYLQYYTVILARMMTSTSFFLDTATKYKKTARELTDGEII